MPQTTLRPVTPITETVVDINIVGNYVHVSFFERDDDFRDKEFSRSWDVVEEC
jgi:hypothetical protein